MRCYKSACWLHDQPLGASTAGTGLPLLSWGAHDPGCSGGQVATTLERQAVDLEAAAHPALDELTANVRTSSLA